jgi:SAM-dependent methyltransferase
MNKEWYSSWFDTPYYHILYKNRDYSEAAIFIDKISEFLRLHSETSCWDLCCGKGRHSLYLNKKGYRVIGTDLSAQSIKEAKLKENERLEFFEHDMRKLFRVNYFDVVFNLFTSFGYFDKAQDDIHVFNSVYKGLKKNGIFVFDFLNSEYVKESLVEYEEKEIDGIVFKITKEICDLTIVKKIEFIHHNQQYHFEENVKAFPKSYFVNLANTCGFEIIREFGTYHLDDFNIDKSPRLILIMQKK